MSEQKTDKLLKDLKAEVSQLEERANQARTLKEHATTEANNLKERNFLAVSAMEEDIESKRKVMLSELSKEELDIKQQISTLEGVKTDLQTDIEELNKSKPPIQLKIDNLMDENSNIEVSIKHGRADLLDITNKIDFGESRLKELRTECDELIIKTTSLSNTRDQIEEDISILQQEATKLEDLIIDQDTAYKDRTRVIDSELSTKGDKLKSLTERLQEAENKDRAIRESLAERQISLEKRERVIKKRELLISDGQARLQAQDDFMKI